MTLVDEALAEIVRLTREEAAARARITRLEAMLKTLVHDLDAAESYNAKLGTGGQTTGSFPRLHSCRAGALIYLRELVREVDPEIAKGGG